MGSVSSSFARIFGSRFSNSSDFATYAMTVPAITTSSTAPLMIQFFVICQTRNASKDRMTATPMALVPAPEGIKSRIQFQRYSAISAPMVPMAAIIVLSVSDEINIPMEIYTQPIRKNIRIDR